MEAKWRFPSGFGGAVFKTNDVLTTEDCSGSDDDDEEEEEDDSCVLPFSFKKYWEAVVKNPGDFAAWTEMVIYAENEKNMPASRKIYDAFLLRFPFSHVYWMKYANLEKQHGSQEVAEKIFALAVESNPLNVFLWTDYISYVESRMDMTLPESVEKLRGIYDKAVVAAGMEFRSDKLWTMYIEWEINQGNCKAAAQLFDRVLSIPTLLYKQHYERFKQFVSTQSPVDILPKEELEWLYSKIQNESDSNTVAAEDSPSEDIADSLTECDRQKIKAQMLKIREQLHLLNQAQTKMRIPFESAITRLYFHSTPLKISQLKSWKRYLEFEISQGQHQRIINLYERCLVACALYEEFWLEYAKYIESHSTEAAHSVFERACRIHLPQSVTLHLRWAEFEERHGELASARAILSRAETAIPGLAILRMKRVNLERRHGNLQEAEKLLRDAVRTSQGTRLSSFYAIKLAQHLEKFQRDPEVARDIISEALLKEPDNPHLHICLMNIEMSMDAEEGVVMCMEQVLKSGMHDSVKRFISQRCLDFFEAYGNNVKSLISAQVAVHTLLVKKKYMRKKSKKWDKVSETKKPRTISFDKPPVVDTDISFPPGVTSTFSTSTSCATTTTGEHTSVSTSTTATSPPNASELAQFSQPAARSARHNVPQPLFYRGHNLTPRVLLPSPPMPPGPFLYGIPNYGPWGQTFVPYTNPPPWAFNQYYPPH